MNSACGREGFFYIRISPELRQKIGGIVSWEDIIDRAESDDDLAKAKMLIEGGLKLFGLFERDILEINTFPLTMMRVDSPYKLYQQNLPAFLIGEAAMRLNFWPGR
jgi:hypothetical protein